MEDVIDFLKTVSLQTLSKFVLIVCLVIVCKTVYAT